MPLGAADPAEAIRLLAARLAARLSCGAEALASEVLTREADTPTYFGGLVAIPHARTRLAPRLALVAGAAKTPIPWPDAESPVRLVLLVAVPPSAIEEYLGAMKILAHMLRRGDAAPQLLSAPDSAAFSVLFEVLAAKAARLK